MPFRSAAQMRHLESQKPDVAAKFVADTKKAHGSFPHGTSHVSAADLDMYRAAVAKHYADMDLSRGQHHAAADQDLSAAPPAAVLAYAQQLQGQTPTVPEPVSSSANPPPVVPPPGMQAPHDMGAAAWQQMASIPNPPPDRAEYGADEQGKQVLLKADHSKERQKTADIGLATKPGTGAASPGAGYDSAFIPAPVARGGVATIPAHEVALVDPNRIAQMGNDEGLVQKAIAQKGDVDAAIANEQGAAANLRGLKQKAYAEDEQDYGAKLDADFQKKTAARDAYANQVADMKVDPGRWMKNQSTANRIRFALAAALGGFAQGMHATRTNVAMDQINRYISDDLDAQQKEIEQKRGHLAQMNGALAEAYRQTGDMKAARHLAHEQLLDAFDQEQKGYALKTGSQTAIANSNLLSAQAQLHKDQQQASYYSYQPERKVAAGAVDPRIKQAEDTAKHLVEQGYAPEDARRRAYAGAGLIYAPDIGEHGKPGQSADDRYQKYQDEMLSKGRQPIPRDEWDKQVSGKPTGGATAGLPEPQSTYGQFWRVFQGNDAFRNVENQQRWNAAIKTAIVNKLGPGAERSPEMIKTFSAPYNIQAGDSQATIDMKVRAARNDFPSLGGGVPEGSDEGLPQGQPEE